MPVTRCNDCKRPSRLTMCERCKAERRRLNALHQWYERRIVCEADRIAKAARLAAMLERVTAGLTPFEEKAA